MKSIKSIKILSLSVGMLGMTVLYSAVNAQEYDDMYFNKSDRKTVKVEKPVVIPENSKDYKEIAESTEAYSAKNVNPEYIARYKSSESNQIEDQSAQNNESYSREDYFVEGYDDKDYTSDPNKNEIDYTALALRDKMSYSNYNRSFASPSWRFSPYMNMGFGNPFYGYGYDPFMMGSGLSMGIGYGFGSGFYPSMSYGMSMSWGTGYNPWGWGGYYPGYYSPYGMGGFYDPWGPMYGYTPYSRFGYSPYYGRYGGLYPSVIVVNNSGSDYINGRKIEYKPRTTRSAATPRYSRTNTENVRVASNDTKVRIPNRTISTSASNGRVSRDYSKVQNEYYSRSRRSTSSAQRISTSNNVRNSYRRGSASTSRFNASSINNNKPSRVSSGSSQYNRSSNRSNAYSGYSSGTRRSSSSSFSTPSRNSSGYSRSSFSSGSSGSRSSSYSSGSRSSSSYSGSRSSGSSRSGRQ